MVKEQIEAETRALLQQHKWREAMAAVYAYEANAKSALVLALARDPRCLPVCAPGCSFCCHLSVFATVPEILYLADRLRPFALTSRVEEVAARVAELSQEERAQAKQPCPLLDTTTGCCGAYDARPLACRAYNSCDKSVCEHAFHSALVRWDMPVDLFQLTLTRNVRAGLTAALRAAGLDPGPYELSTGLAVALRLADAEARWLRGENVFAAAETRIGRERRATFL